jgi:transcriptional regulator NrdR family protein
MAQNNQRSEPRFVILSVWVLVDQVDKMLELENKDQVRSRTVGQIVRDEVQANLDSVWYVRHTRVQLLKDEVERGGA